MYQIQLLRRQSTTETLYSSYMETSEVDDVSTKTIYETENLTELEKKLEELLLTYPMSQIHPIVKLRMGVDVMIEDSVR